MAYLSDPRENRIGPNGETWEADGRVETRYLWNGAYVDLCDLPPVDYAKTIFVTSPTGENPYLKANPITVKIEETDGNLTFYAVAQSPVASDMSITLTLSDTTPVQLKIAAGSLESQKYVHTVSPGEAKPTVENSVFKPKQDAEYSYQVIVPDKPVKQPEIYNLTIKNGLIEGMEPGQVVKDAKVNERLPMLNLNETAPFNAEIPYVDIPGLMNGEVTPGEVDRIVMENAVDVVLVTDSVVDKIYANDKNADDTANWKESNPYQEGDRTYHIWYRRDVTGPHTNIEDTKAGHRYPDKSWSIIVTFK